jgi:CubicO group peptidase (beta-lactamase class C family)
MSRTATLLATLCFSIAAPAAASAPSPGQVDALFAKWNKPDTPGAVVAVLKDGKVVFQGAYGMADIERDAANRAATSFHIASISKQFTAFAIHLLAQEGKLGLDDDVHKYLPELPDYGTAITIDELLHHTSGLRDQWNLLAMAGWRMDDVITEDDVFDIVRRQKSLNFKPGQEHLYCNTGYTLLGLIVKRVSGQSLQAFAQERMFAPLGMQHTRFQDNYRTLVKGRASSYVRGADGAYQYVALSYSNVGATSLFTTIDDLARWDQNFYDGKVGGLPLLARMQSKGKLANGKVLPYASGLAMIDYRGLDVVEHGGADAGFRSELMRFPKQHLSVVILANAGDLNAGKLARDVADLYLDDVPGALPAPANKAAAAAAAVREVRLSAPALDAFVGEYALAPNFSLRFLRDGERLLVEPSGQERMPVFASGERTFFSKAVEASFTFDAPGKDGVVGGGVLHQNGRDMPARRVTRSGADVAQLREKSGEFYSDELHVLYTLTQKDGQLVLRHPRGETAMKQESAHVFSGAFPIGKLRFNCVAGKGCYRFSLDNGRVRNLVFSKVTISPTGPDPIGAAFEMAPDFAGTPFYLRGSMNQWSTKDQLVATGPAQYAVRLTLAPGLHEFKIGSEDFSAIDLGAFGADDATALGQPKKLGTAGANLKLTVATRGAYLFTLDTSDALAPRLTVRN